MSFLIRKFEDRDAEKVSEIMYESFKTVFHELWDEKRKLGGEYWKKNAHSSTPDSMATMFVAEQDGTVIGCLHISANITCGLGVLESIGVDPNIFAKGVGRAMVAEAEKLWKELRMRKIYTCTSHINQRALAFYKSLGFEEEGILKNHFFEGINEIQLAKFYKYDD